tara:strand:+ start:76 stop:696 length:621 start_codon:yes stop_codon:yes gene_type:complete
MVNEIAIIWMSAGNSYFDEKTVKKLLEYASKNFERIVVISPDKPAEHNFRALGYPENKVRRKAKLNANLLINRIKRILNSRGDKSKFKIVDWESEIMNNKHYISELNQMKKLYINNLNFRKTVKETTLEFLNNKINNYPRKSLDEASLYLIEELSFVLASPKIYGSNNVKYLYHKNWKIFEDFIKGKFDGKKRRNFSLVITGIKNN